ncbi:MAG: VapE domain-containing protein [Synechococcus sp.]
MMSSSHQQWTFSGKRNPCPICGRVKDGDCRISTDGLEVICHHPKDLKPGEVVNGWAFTGNTSDGRGGHFTVDKPADHRLRASRKVVPLRVAPAPVLSFNAGGAVDLARIPEARPPQGSPWFYGPHQRIERVDQASGKIFIPQHYTDGGWVKGAGSEPWPVFGISSPGWVLELEGEKCCEIALAAGVSAISQPGHAHKVEQMAERYRGLQVDGVAGVVYLADNDDEGQRRALQAQQAAAEAGLPLVVLPAVDVWPDLPKGGSIDDAPGTPAERVAALMQAIPQKQRQLRKVEPEDQKRRRLAPDEVLSLLPEHLGGMPRLNIRTRAIQVGGRTITGNEAGRLYLTLSDPSMIWPKEVSADALQELAEQQAFDPVADYLNSISGGELLPMADWGQLDQLLFNISDPHAAAFLQKYLIGAVARALDPGCAMRQLPVLIGPQGIGKSRAGRELFGPEFFSDQLTSRLDVDDVTRLHRHWCCELGELDGITRRTDQESLKAFISRQVDVERRKYARTEEDMPRRSVFWGSSNAAPLRDSTGSSRFVCIALPNAALPVERVKEHRDVIWARAVEQYMAGVAWHSDLAELRALAESNADFEQSDPWMETIRAYVELRQFNGVLPVKVPDVLERLEIPLAAQNNQNTARARSVLQQLGWSYCRRRMPDGQQRRGFWPPEQ